MADNLRNAQLDWVEMRHPQVPQSQRCAPSAVKHWEKRGWRVVSPADKAATPAKKVAPASGPSGAGKEA